MTVGMIKLRGFLTFNFIERYFVLNYINVVVERQI